MNKSEFGFLVESGNSKLAAAYAILLDNSECVLLRSFEDAVYLTQRIKAAEDIIKNEEESELKKKICDRIEGYKSMIRSVVELRKTEFASIITAERAEYRYSREFYKRVINELGSEDKHGSFYEWIFAIENME